MNEVVVVTDGGEETPAEVVTEVVEAINEVIDNVVEELQTEEQRASNVDLAVGALLATVEALSGRVAEVESKLENTTSVAEIAIDAAFNAEATAMEVAEEVREDATPTEEEISDELPPVIEDEKPRGKRQKFSEWFFGPDE